MMTICTNDGASSPSSSLVPSAYQSAVYANVAAGKGHTVVLARAGSGKTTTTMNALAHVPRGSTIALFAFNKSIAEELGRRAPKGVEVKTLHSHGFSAVRRAFPGVKVDDKKSFHILAGLFGAETNSDPAHPEYSPVTSHYGDLVQLVRYAKDTLTSADVDALDALMDRFQVDGPSDDGQAYEDAYENPCAPEEVGPKRRAFLEAAAQLLLRSREITDTIDFSDMCWLPVVLRLRVWAFDRVFVDETQDLSPSQIEMLLMCVRRGGRICAVGDDRQAVYAFRGADVSTVDRLIERLDATVLPLSVTYRCPRSVVELAQTEVPDLQAAPGAKEGEIVQRTPTAMFEQAAEGDMIISRSNAPLLGMCFAFWKAGKRAKVLGRDVGEGLLKLVKSSRASTIEELLAWLGRRTAKEIARRQASKRPTSEIEDKQACIVALCEDVESVDAVVERIKSLFADDPARGTIVLGTTHKLKGLEAKTVWMLRDTYRRERGGEEANCWYVAVTRAQERLVMVPTPKSETAVAS